MRRTFRALAAAMVCTSLAAQAMAASFVDVAGTPYSEAFAYLSDRGFVQGYGDGTGKPFEPINRAEALKVLLTSNHDYAERLTWYQGHMPPISLFSDVQQSDWYASYIEVAFERKIVTGYPDGSFRPSQFVTVEEAIAMLMRAYREPAEPGFLQSAYINNLPGEWFTPVVNTAIKRNVIMERDRLLVGTPVTRGQFFDMVYRMHVVKSTGVVAFQSRQPTTVVQQPVVRPQPATGGTTYTPPQPTYVASNPAPAPTPTAATAVHHQYGSNKPFAVTIPSANITDLTITHPDDPFSSEGVLAPLQQGVGHLFSYPGGGGKIMIYGHSSGYPWDVSQYTKIFRKINELQPGDRIYVTYEGTLYVYEVTFEEAIPAADTSRFNDNGEGEELILYTCWPPDSISQRYLIHALPVETVALR